MPLSYNTGLPGAKPSVNISGGAAKVSPITDSSSRKYVSSDAVQNYPVQNQNTTSNAEHIVGASADMSSTATVAQQAAASARDQITAVKAQIAAITPNTTKLTLTPAKVFSDSDLNLQQNQLATSIFASIGKTSFLGVDAKNLAISSGLIKSSLAAVLPFSDHGNGIQTNTAVPAIDHVEVSLDKKQGLTDAFVATVTFSIPRSMVASGKITSVRVFRAEVQNPDFARTAGKLSVHAMDILRSDNNRSRAKNQDYLGIYESQARQAGVSNAVTSLNPIDPSLNTRLSTTNHLPVSERQLTSVSHPQNDGAKHAALSSYVDSKNLLDLDFSVINDLKSLRNIQIQNPGVAQRLPSDVLHVGRSTYSQNPSRVGLAQQQETRNLFPSNANNQKNVVAPSNNLNFKEILFTSLSKISSHLIGNYIEYSFDDPTITFGKSYRYYALSVDTNMQESQRSRIVQIDVDGLRVPSFPSKVSARVISSRISLSIMVEDELVEKFEIYRKTEDSSKEQPESAVTNVISSISGFNVSTATRKLLKNNFLQVGESLNGHKAGSIFYDRNVQPGTTYTYRVFSVDIFGNKSERPNEFSIFYPEPSNKKNDLRKPTLLAEIDTQTSKVKLSIHAADPRLVGLFLTRRDLTAGQEAFVPPGQIDRIKFGLGDPARGPLKFDDIHASFDTDNKINWKGYFRNDTSQIIFVDRTTIVDRTYQYKLYGIDRFGNQSPIEISRPLFVENRPRIAEPVNLVASVLFSGSDLSIVDGIQLNWQDGNIDVSSEDLVGNRETLRQNSVRTLYQVERRLFDGDGWEEFPMVDSPMFFDPSLNEVRNVNANNRPSYVKENQTYVYRVQAFQSGAFISNFSRPIVVPILSPIFAPVNLRLLTCDAQVRPFFVAINWDNQKSNNIIDRWEIERSAANNFAAATLSSNNPQDFKNLIFTPFKVIYSESSRFRERTDDESSDTLDSEGGLLKFFTGENFFIDLDVEFGNSYFYRIRSVSAVNGDKSEWAYRGIKVTDELQEQKIEAVMTQDEKDEAAQNFAAISLKKTTPAQLPIHSNFSYKTPSLPPEKAYLLPKVTVAHVATVAAKAPQINNSYFLHTALLR